MFSFHGPNPSIERQKIWNLETILEEWETLSASAHVGESPGILPPGSNHRQNLHSLLGCFLRLELAEPAGRRISREIFASASALLEHSGITWQVSRNDFLWGELFSRFGHALSTQGEPWLGAYVSCLVPRALKLRSLRDSKTEFPSLSGVTEDCLLSGDWLRDREELAGDPLQAAICDYLLSSNSSKLLELARDLPPGHQAELRLLALFTNNQALLKRVGSFSSLAKKTPESGSLPYFHSLEGFCGKKLTSPQDWLEAGEALAKALGREKSQRLALLAIAFVARVATAKRQPALANFLFRAYSQLAKAHRDPYGILIQSTPAAAFLPVTALSRGATLLNLTKELGLLLGRRRFQKLLSTRGRIQLAPFERQRLLELTAQEMTRLKGPVMKLGQMVTYIGTDLRPAERSLFDRLWQDSSPLPFPAIFDQLSEAQKDKLQYVEATPLGCGSVSQVHRAIKKNGGENVALKVLLPGLPQVMKADFQVLRTLLPVGRWLAPGVPLEEFHRELEQNLFREIDFRAEAEALQKLKGQFTQFPDIHVPAIHPELCSDNVLAMSLERGKNFQEFIRTAAQEERDRAGQAIVRFVVSSVKERFFNSDPHPGNYLFNGSRVTFLDFGAAAAWDKRTSDAWNGLILAFLHYDIDRFVEALRLVNGISSRASKEDIQRALDFFAKPQEGFWNTGTVSALDPDISVRQIQGLMKSFSGSHLPIRLYPKFLFGMRVYLGHIHLVARLGSRANWKELVHEIFVGGPSAG